MIISRFLLSPTFSRLHPELATSSVHRIIAKKHTDFSSSTTPLSTDIPFLKSFHNGSYQTLMKKCLTDEGNLEYWKAMGENCITWQTPFQQVSQCNMSEADLKWYLGGKVDVTENCVYRHARENGDKVALIWEKDAPGQEEYVTYRELGELVHRMTNTLSSHGVKKGDRVVIYMPMTPLIVAAMLACTRLGAIHTVVFAGFSADALAARIMDTGAQVVVTADQAVRGGRIIDLKRTVDSAISKCPAEQVQHVLMHSRTGDVRVPMTSGRDVPLETVLSQASAETSPLNIADSEDPLFILYTSGSTGKPKGLMHTTAGYLVFVSSSHRLVFDLPFPTSITAQYNSSSKNYILAQDRFGCVADVGWITGHSYVVYGPLCNGTTTLLFESTPTYPDPGRYWEMVQRLRLSHIYMAPTALRLLLKHGDEWVTKYDRSSLRLLGSVGEPLNHEAWEWYHRVVGQGRCDIVDTWWQTETGGILISPRPSALGAPIHAGMPMRPLPGVDVVLMTENDKSEDHPASKQGYKYGALCLRRPWPGIARSIWGDPERFKSSYFNTYPGHFFSGDGALLTEEGYYQITGRIDDVINTSGHRLGTAEIEDVLDEHHAVAESAVVGCPHPVKGEAIYAFVTLRDKFSHTPKEIVDELCMKVRNQVAPYAVPEVVQVTPGLPKTRSGKIMRRILKKIAMNETENLGDTSTLSDPQVVEILVKDHNEIMQKKKKSNEKKK